VEFAVIFDQKNKPYLKILEESGIHYLCLVKKLQKMAFGC